MEQKVNISVEFPECGELGADHPITGLPHCILSRKLTQVQAQSVSDMKYDTKVNPYESFENPTPPVDRLVFLSYVLLFFILTCIAIVFVSSISGIRKNTILIFAFLLILLLALLQKRDVD
jgi:NADH:ubiquinone oxidoreductase subunit 3 (subunit A)